ncbi:proline-rich AKT1 substrate 1 isoform X2 [Bacillus rossius redtenbacheri]|uniref:proline-rich AKT1 substrate 1 isoform X2 n=1 Tax=Bacillus rossius redtenbacheri TaxID=93214 RepID=UPI002FDCFC17
MLITCRCLNVSIKTKNCEFINVDIADLSLTIHEQNDRFFKEVESQGVFTVELALISKEQPSLVLVRDAGDWVVHHCLGCGVGTHAIHREKGAALVLVSRAMLMNAAEIDSLKNSEHYSKVFRIIIESDDSAPAPSKFAVSQLPAPAQAALSALQQQLGETVQQEAARTEERVRQFTEAQYAALEEFRERAHREHRVLARVLCEVHGVLQPSPEGLDTPPSTPDARPPPPAVVPAGPGGSRSAATPPLRLGRHLPLSAGPPSPAGGNSAKPEKRAVPVRLITQMSSPARRSDSLDTEGLFDLEGMEDNHTETFHSEDESESDDSGSHDEGIHIPRGRADSHGQMAKSLPVNVPTFLAKNKEESEDMDDERYPQDPMDIAASIKALAKSVHGEANVFGDLPRPRFSTNI